MTSLIWTPTVQPEGLSATSGSIYVGHAVKRSTDGAWVWQITAVHTKFICKGFGEVGSRSAAKQGLSRAWNIWKREAGL